MNKFKGLGVQHDMLIRVFTLLCCLLLITDTLATSAKVYVWRDKNGQLVYSDTPKPGAEELKVRDPNIAVSSIDTSVLDITPQQIPDNYSIEITQPINNATIRDNTGSVAVTGRVLPVFKRGLKVQLKLDNALQGEPQKFARFIMRNVDRGEHTVVLELVDDKGKVIASSTPVTFYLHRVSIIKRN
jgi:hypothetical protein